MKNDLSHKVKRVLYVSANGYLGGAERFVVEAFCAHQNNQELEVYVLFFSDGKAAEICKNLNNERVIILPFSLRMRNPIAVIKAILFVKKIINELEIDIVHSTMAYPQIIVGLASIFSKVKTVWFQHGPVGSFLDFVAASLPVDQILFNSHYTQTQHEKMKWGFTPRLPHKIIHLGIKHEEIDEKFVSELKLRYKKNPDDKILLMAGRISEIKGYDLTIKALAKIKNENFEVYQKIHLLIIGSAMRETDKAYALGLEQLSLDLGISDRILFISFTDKIRQYFKASDLLILPTKIGEAFGLVVGEAMLDKTFIIGSSFGGVQDILRDGETGLVFNPTSNTAVDDLTTEVLKWYQLPTEQKTNFIQNAFHLINREYSVEKMERELSEIYSLM